MKKAATEMKYILDGIKSRFIDTKKWITELKDRVMEIMKTEQKKELKERTVWQTFEMTSSILTFSLQGSQIEKKEQKRQRTYLKTIAENFLKLGKETHI